MFNPWDHYWQRGDEIYSSARQTIVADDDDDYVAWVAAGGVPSRWPAGGDGEQTDASLQDILRRFGLTLWPLARSALLTAYAADKRWRVETGGITVGGGTIDTSRDSQAMITGAYVYSQANPAEIVKFKAVNGWVDLDAATMAAIATAVGAHVQACFAAEAAIAGEIEAGTITTTSEIDEADWPQT